MTHASTAAMPLWPSAEGHPALSRMTRLPAQVPPPIVHVIPSLSLGGAERIGIDLAARAAARGVEAVLMVLRDVPEEHSVPGGIRVERLGALPWQARIDAVAAACARLGTPAYCHLTSPQELQRLWKAGAETIPVVHNVRDGWHQQPSDWLDGNVPFAVACGERVRLDLAAAGCPVPVVALRHVMPAPRLPDPIRRNVIRNAMGARPGTLLVGMVGRVVPQKDYTRAVRTLAALRARGADARLAVIGPVPPGETGARDEAIRVAADLGVRDHVLFLGGLRDAGGLVPAFDVFLNTSRFEGVSISTMEAVAAGVPVVSADVGGQDEAVGPGDVLLPADAAPEAFAEAVLAIPRAGSDREDLTFWVEAMNDQWSWNAALRSASFAARPHGADVLFVTGNLDVGGAQRSLSNLASELARRGRRIQVGVCGPVGVPEFLEPMLDAGVEVLDLSDFGHWGGPGGRAGMVLGAVARSRPTSVCFWNMDAITKVGVAKALAGSATRVVDASPGPALFRELDEEAGHARLLSSSPAAYLASLDAFVSKYRGGLPDGIGPDRGRVIPNGVRVAAPLPDGEGPAPIGDPELAVLVVGRLNATKRVDLLARIADGLAARVPGATLTAVGGVHVPRDGIPVSDSLRFLPPDTRAAAFAGRFACLLMLSREQGCPNASLEAMAAGIPVVANSDGGTSEQVIDRVTGRLIPDGLDDEALVTAAVDALADVLSDPKARLRMGLAALRHVSLDFTVGAMADAYSAILL